MAGILRGAETLEHANVSMWLEKALAVLPEKRPSLEGGRESRSPSSKPDSRPSTRRWGPHVACVLRTSRNGVIEGEQRRAGTTPWLVEELSTISKNAGADPWKCAQPRRVGQASGFLQVATVGESPAMPTTESGRRELANWLASAKNPLTARVIVNRVWQWLFGVGIVRTPDNFGTTGETRATSSRSTIWLSCSSTTAGRSNDQCAGSGLAPGLPALDGPDDRASRLATDPENRPPWRANRQPPRRRMHSRDAMLAVSGELRLEMRGPTFPAGLAVSDFGYAANDAVRPERLFRPCFVMPCPRSSRCSTLPTRACGPDVGT